MNPLERLEKLAALVPLPRAHLVRYAGCLAPPSQLRAAIIPTPRQQGVEGDATKTGPPYWTWVRLLGRVCDVAMATCPLCRRGSLRIIAAILPPLRGRREARRRAAPTQSRLALRPSPRSRSSPVSCTMARWPPFHLPSPRPAFAKRYVRLTRPTPAWPRGEVRAAVASFTPLRLAIPVEIVPPQGFPDEPLRGPRSRHTPDAVLYPLLIRLSRRRETVPRLAVRCCGGLPRRAGDTASAVRGPQPLAGGTRMRQGCLQELRFGRAGAKMPFVSPIRDSGALRGRESWGAR
jgi:hypothetical protein